MSLWFEKTWHHGYQYGIWKIEEDEAFFLQSLELHNSEIAELSRIKGRRRLEWLASRYLVHHMVSDEPDWDRIPMLKDEFGKPHIDDHELFVSFSHSYEFVAVILGKMIVGIDIQKFVPKITALERKFMRGEEANSLHEDSRLQHLHIYWGAKEALYKCYGRRQLDFCRNILIEPFTYREHGSTKGIVSKGDFNQSYEIFFEKRDNYFLVYALESGPPSSFYL